MLARRVGVARPARGPAALTPTVIIATKLADAPTVPPATLSAAHVPAFAGTPDHCECSTIYLLASLPGHSKGNVRLLKPHKFRQ